MINKLRKKFVSINMALVSVVLGIVVVSICISNVRKYQNEIKATH